MKIINKYYHYKPKKTYNLSFIPKPKIESLADLVSYAEKGECVLIGEEFDIPAPEKGTKFFTSCKSEGKQQTFHFLIHGVICFRDFVAQETTNVIILTNQF